MSKINELCKLERAKIAALGTFSFEQHPLTAPGNPTLEQLKESVDTEKYREDKKAGKHHSWSCAGKWDVCKVKMYFGVVLAMKLSHEHTNAHYRSTSKFYGREGR